MPAIESMPRPWQAQALWTSALLLPFVILNLGAGKEHPLDQPPPIIRSERIAEGRHVLRLSQQPDHMRVDWISPQQGGRHHTLRVCMAYRGEHLRCIADAPAILTDDRVWRSEYFLVNGRLLENYQDYLLHTFLPGSSAGVHLIFSVNAGTMPAREFESKARDLALRIHQQQQTHALAFICRRLALPFRYRRSGHNRDFEFAQIVFRFAQKHRLKVIWLGLRATLIAWLRAIFKRDAEASLHGARLLAFSRALVN
jgi:hypothetical protein